MIYARGVLQKSVSLNSTEAKYFPLSEACKTTAWLRRLLFGLNIPEGPRAIYDDNSGAIE